MRKALIGLIMAATVMTPIAAEAQRRGQNQRAEQTQRGGERNQQRSEARQARQEARQENRQERRQPRQAQAQPRQAQAQPPVQVAQRERGNRGNRGDRGNRGNRGDSGYQRGWQGPNTPQNREAADRYNRRAQENAIRYGTPAQRRDAVRDARRDDRRDDRRDRRYDRRDDRRDWRNDRRGWSNGWRNDRRYDWRGWRNGNRNIFRGSRYYAPYRGWNYRRFNIGLILQPLFYSQNYWIGDPWQYRLPPAPYGTQWVRYYNDVLLVDVDTGEVVDAIYDFYW